MNARNGKDSTVSVMVPYAYGDPRDGFAYDKDSIDANKYVDMLIDAYNSSKADIDFAMQYKYGDNIADTGMQKEVANIKHTGYYFEKIFTNMYTSKNQEMTIDDLLKYYRSGEPFCIILNPYRLGQPNYADLESDIKNWSRESVRIHNLHISDDPREDAIRKLKALSKKDLKLVFEDARSVAILRNCKMQKYINNRKFAFLCEKIIFKTEGR